MLQSLKEIAPLTTWGLVLAAAMLMLLAFVAFGHAKLVHGAYKQPYRGPLSPTALETSLRWAAILLLTGFVCWGLTLAWPAPILLALAAPAAACLALEVIARARHGSGSI